MKVHWYIVPRKRLSQSQSGIDEKVNDLKILHKPLRYVGGKINRIGQYKLRAK